MELWRFAAISLSLLSLLSLGLAKFNLFRVLKERSKTLNTKRNKEKSGYGTFLLYTQRKRKMRRAESGASLSNKAPAVGGAVNAFLHSGCEYGASVVWSWLFLLCFFSLKVLQKEEFFSLRKLRKMSLFFTRKNSGIKERTPASSFFARRRLVYSFEAIFSLSLSFTLLFSRVCLNDYSFAPR